MKRIAILDDYQGAALRSAPWDSLAGRAEVTVLREAIPEGDRASRLANFDILVLNRERTPVAARLLEQLPKLELIVTFGMRNAAIDLDAAARLGITVCGTKTLGYPTAELTWALILALFRNLPVELGAIRSGAWQTTVGRGLRGKTLGLVGFGRIGRDVARVGAAFGMRVLAYSRSLTSEAAAQAGAERRSWEQLLAEADVLSLHLPLNASTRGIIGSQALAAMKPGAVLVNTARGALVEEDALIEALQSGRLAGAAIDTFEQEPIGPDHPLARFPSVILTPHLGYVIEENYRVTFGEALEDVTAWLDGAPVRVVAGPTLEKQ